jgi:sarcosine oxidase, subunit gamma
LTPDVLRRGPLDGVALPRATGVAVRTLVPAQRFLLCGEASALGGVAAAFGVGLPGPLSAASKGARASLWLGPDEWLLVADESTSGLETELGDVLHSLVDVSHRQVALEISGERGADALNFGVALDLDSAAFPVDRVVRTLFAKAEIILWRREETVWRIEVARSFAAYMVDTLAAAVSGLP